MLLVPNFGGLVAALEFMAAGLGGAEENSLGAEQNNAAASQESQRADCSGTDQEESSVEQIGA